MRKTLFLLFILALAVLITACGEQKNDVETAELTDTTAETEAETADGKVQITDAVKVTSNDGGFDIRTAYLYCEDEDLMCQSYEYDGRYTLFITYSVDSKDNWNTWYYKDTTLHILDKEEGKFVPESFKLENFETLCSDISYRDGSCIIFSWKNDSKSQKPTILSTYEVKCDGGSFSVTPVKENVYPVLDEHLTSPDGKNEVYYAIEDSSGHGGTVLKKDGKKPVTVLENVIGGDKNGSSAGDMRGYSPVGFIDDTHFIYNIIGGAWSIGYGIFDTDTGKSKLYENEERVMGVDAASGVIYTSKLNDNYMLDYYMTSPEGEKKLIFGSQKGNNGAFSLLYSGGYLIKITSDKKNADRFAVSVFDDDTEHTLAELSVSKLLFAYGDGLMYFCGKTLTAVVPTSK